MALHDILGKVAGLPLFRLLGGTKNTFETDITTSLDTLENMTAEPKKYANMRCMVGCMLESKLALTAAAHVVASQANIVYADLDGNSEHVTDPIIDGMTVKAGVLTLPEKPGLGCDVDPAFVKKLRKV